MDFTFGIITGGGNDAMINEIIISIEKECIPNYEVIIVGECNINRINTVVINFDETIKPMWITKKKNIITKKSKFENIVYLHDYIKLENGWYEGQIMSGNDFKVRMDKIYNYNGERFRDWCLYPDPKLMTYNIAGLDCLIPYDMTHLSKYMYISGSYWVAKKDIMLEIPLDENLIWGQSEDIVWSEKVKEKYDFKMNSNSSVRIMKPNKNRVFNEPNEYKINLLRSVV